MFKNLSSKLTGILDRLSNKGSLSEADVENALREIRVVLLEADVALPVAKELIEQIKAEAVGEKIIKSVRPGQMVVKIVQDKLTELLGSEHSELALASDKKPQVIMLVGLQGAGKTTIAGKLSKYLQANHPKILLASLDIYRPAAQEQLAILAEQVGVDSLEIIAGQKPDVITKRALTKASKEGYDLLILDTAGRLHIDNELMAEVKNIEALARPDETLLVADSLTGQDAANVAKAFKESLTLTGVVLTRIDADSRGGAALSLRMITGVPIKFLGTGEKLENFELFYPERIASRILDKGDIVSLVEKAQQMVDEQEAQNMVERIKSGKFDLNDFISQIKGLKKLGGISGVMSMIPGIGQMAGKLKAEKLNDNIFERYIAIYNSMTKQERRDPRIINGSRKKRIALGSGSEINEVNKLLKQFRDAETVFKKIGKFGGDEKALLNKFGHLLG